MLKRKLGLVLTASMLFCSINAGCPVPVSGEEVSSYETKIKSFDPEYTMWTDKMIDEGFAALSPNENNKDLSDTKTPYGRPTDSNLTKWAKYEFLWTHGYPVGNGRMSAVVMGGIDKEVIQINEDTVWTGSPYVDADGNFTGGTTKDAWRYFRGADASDLTSPAAIGSSDAVVGDEEFRTKFPNFADKSISNMSLNISNIKDYSSAEGIAAVQGRYDIISMVEKYFLGKPKTQKAYQSFVETYLDFGQKNEGVSNYTKALDMRNASVTVDYDYNNVHYTRETIASYPAQTIATNIKSNGGELNFDAQLHTFLDDSNGEHPVFEKIDNNHIKVTAKVKGGKKDKDEPGGLNQIKAEARLYVDAPDSEVSVSEDNTKIIIKGGNEATVYVVGATNYVDYKTLDDNKPSADCDKYMQNIIGKTYQQIKTAHENDYKELFERSYISIANNGFDAAGIPTEKRIRKDIGEKDDKKSGFSSGGGNSISDADKYGVHSTFEDGDNKIAALDFNYGKYLMIAGSRDKSNNIPMSQPLNLTGKWNPSLSPSWNGKYTININTEMNYWLAQPLNLAECERPLLDVFADLAESGSVTAKEQYGIKNSRKDDNYKPGDPWVMHHNFDLWRGTQPIDNATAGLWPTGGVWLLDHAWQYYLYNKDKNYLNEFYPLMKGACSFFTQFLVVDPKTGYLVTAASCSPEQGSVQPGPAMDTQLIRNLYYSTIEAAEILEKSEEDAELIAKMKEQLPKGGYLADEKNTIAPNIIDNGGLINEWARGDVTFDFSNASEDDENKWSVRDTFNEKDVLVKEHTASNNSKHRHCSHLWELYPGTHINQYSENENMQAIFKAYQKSVDAREAGSGQGWGVAWRIALSARALDGNTAYKRIEQLLRTRTSPNMFGQHPNFQIDCNYGLTAGVVEMLLQSHNDTIDILPALPDKWGEGKFKGFKARGNIEVGASWKNGLPKIVNIKAIDGGEIKVRNPYMGTAVVKDSEGNVIDSALESNNTVIVFNAKENVDYTISGFGEIPQEEGTREVIWEKKANVTADFFNDGGGQVPKQEKPEDEDGGNVGHLINNNGGSKGSGNGEAVGFSYPDCELDGLKKLELNINTRFDNIKISVRKGSKDGEEIASAVLPKSSAYTYVDLPLKGEFTGTAKLFIVLTNDKNEDNYIANVKQLRGTRVVTYKNYDILKIQKDGKDYIKNAIMAGKYTIGVDFDKLENINDACVITAFYDDNDKLISSSKHNVSRGSNSVDVDVSAENAKNTMKIMLWNDADKMLPLRAVKVLVK